MQFSDTTNYNGLIQACEDWTGLGRSQISGNTARLKLFTRLINKAYDKYTMLLLNSQDEWDFDDINHTDYPLLTTSLVANQQDYTLAASDNVLKIKRVEISYDGTNWKLAQPIDVGEVGDATDTTSIGNDFNTNEPYYDMEANALKLYPIPSSAVTNGLKIWVYRNVDAFTTADTTQAPGFDRAFHEMIAMRASLDWAAMKGKDVKNDLNALLQEDEGLFIQHYGNKQKDRMIEFKSGYSSSDWE